MGKDWPNCTATVNQLNLRRCNYRTYLAHSDLLFQRGIPIRQSIINPWMQNALFRIQYIEEARDECGAPC